MHIAIKKLAEGDTEYGGLLDKLSADPRGFFAEMMEEQEANKQLHGQELLTLSDDDLFETVYLQNIDIAEESEDDEKELEQFTGARRTVYILGLFDSGVMQGDDVFLLTTVIVCMLTSMNTISACSVSLEGDSLWVVRSLPVSAWNVLKAKLHLHILVTGAPILICGFLVGVGVGLGVLEILLTIAMATVGVLFFGAFGLTVNLKFPNLKWTNETVAVKQGVATMITMFGGWGVVLTPVLLYFLIGEYFVAWAYVLLWLFVMAGATVGLIAWLKKRGTRIFERL
jgi:hypothetical protein